MGEPLDTTDRRWTFDDQQKSRALGVKGTFQYQLDGKLIGSVRMSGGSFGPGYYWTSDNDTLIEAAKELMTKFPGEPMFEKLFQIMVSQKIRGL